MEMKAAVLDYFFSTVAQYVTMASVRMLLTQFVLYWDIRQMGQSGPQDPNGVYNPIIVSNWMK